MHNLKKKKKSTVVCWGLAWRLVHAVVTLSFVMVKHPKYFL